MGKNDKKGGGDKGAKGKGGGDAGKDSGGKGTKGAQSINVRHILVRRCYSLRSLIVYMKYNFSLTCEFAMPKCEKHAKKEEALAKLNEGVKFDEVARNFSEDKARQGDDSRSF
jgi:NIMA-interacting peptidyl-prolyl cis-trans isomerase 4